MSNEKLREQYERSKEVQSVDAEDESEIRIAMLNAVEDAGFSTEEGDKILAREFNTFAEGEKYDYATDLRRTFDSAVATPLETKIFKRIPKHVFWDIKKPLTGHQKDFFINPYNPARKYPFETFFDMRNHEEWLQSREEKRNITANISRHTRI